MFYTAIVPPAILKPYVRYFWTLETPDEDPVDRTFRTMADGCPGIIYQHPDNGTFFQQDKKLPDTFLFGQTTQYAEINLSGRFNTVGVYLQPNAVQNMFGYKADELTDSCLDLDLFAKSKGFSLSEQLANTGSASSKVNILMDYLTTLAGQNNERPNNLMQYALDQIIYSKGSISLKNLQAHMQLTERSFHRKFTQYTGISPKLFCRICRFQASLKQLQETKYDKLSDIAFGHDYADQSHFIRSFKEFSGMSPTKYQQLTNGIIENLAEVVK